MAKAPVRRLTARRTASSKGIAGVRRGKVRTASEVLASGDRRSFDFALRAPLRMTDLGGGEVESLSMRWAMISVSVSEDELVAFGDQLLLQGEVVLHDAVVHDDQGAGAVAVGVGVLLGGPAVGGPAGVADAEAALDGALGDDGFQVAQLARGAAQLQACGASGYGDAG